MVDESSAIAHNETVHAITQRRPRFGQNHGVSDTDRSEGISG